MNPNVQTRFKARQNFTQEDWAELDSRNNEAEHAELLNKAGLVISAPYFINLFKSVLDRLLAGGIITYEDSEGRYVVYDGKDVSNNGTIHPEILMNNITSWQFPYKGVVVLGGDGNDMLYGTEYPVHPDGSPNPYLYPCPDYLYGGTGNDTLDGGSGKGFGEQWNRKVS